MSFPQPIHERVFYDLNQVVDGARNGSPRELVVLAQNWTSFSNPLRDQVPSIFFQHLNPLNVPTDVDTDPLDIEASEQPPIASVYFRAFWSLWGLSKLLYIRTPDHYEPEIIRAWPGIFKWSTFLFTSRVRALASTQGVAMQETHRSTFMVRAMTRDAIAGAWWGIASFSSVRKAMTEIHGFLEVAVGLWIHEDDYKLDDLEVAARRRSGRVVRLPSDQPIPSSLLEFFMHMFAMRDVHFVENIISVAGGVEKTALIVVGRLKRALKARELKHGELSVLFRLIVDFFQAPQLEIREAIMNHRAGVFCTKLLVRIASCIQDSYPKRRQDLEEALVIGFGCIMRLIETTDGFSWIVQMLKAGILSAFVEASPVVHGLRDDEWEIISIILSTIIPSFLCYRSVVDAADTALQNLERTERFRSLPKTRVWKVFSDFTKLTMEHKMIITLYIKILGRNVTSCSNAECKKVDRLKNLRRCGSCLSTFYCSHDCQRADWKLGHKEYCKTSDDHGLSFRDWEYFEHLSPREACRNVPYLKVLAAKEYPGVPLTDLVVTIDHRRVPVIFNLNLESEFVERNPGVPTVRPGTGERPEKETRTIIVGIFPYGKGLKSHCTYFDGGIWSIWQQDEGEPPIELDPTGKRFIDSIDMLAQTKWRDYWGIDTRT
ncbi:hypothetical protein BDN72DRAFT_958673 [Pluteus cervinus]|uniref:Uncharacterized protein n=1 Tax=Pluteus cervinus TaxID=181527 RepID=A0ACD3AXU1_9AGAR|nr:hypothetical protein BDN72DRAFT_958673 [Pluteus cervinus]